MAEKNGFAPHNMQAEKTLLGTILQSPNSFAQAATLEPQDFYIKRHAWLWEGIQAIRADGGVVAFDTIVAWLDECGRLAEFGGAAYALGLITNTSSLSDVHTHAETISRASVRRRLVNAASIIARDAHDTELDIGIVLARADAVMVEAKRGYLANKRVTNLQVATQTSKLIDGILEPEKDENRIDAGFPQFEEANMRLARGLNVAVLGASGVGKSSLVTQMTLNMAERGCRVLTVPLEMPPAQVMLRMAQSSTTWKTAKGKTWRGVTKAQIKASEDAYVAAQKRVSELSTKTNLLWAATEQSSIAAIESELMRLTDEGGPVDAIIIDSVQKLDDIVNAPRSEELIAHKKAWTKLARLAIRYNVMVIGVSEFNKTGGLDRRPKLDDIPQGGHHELDIVMGLYRKHYAKHDADIPDVQTIEVEGLKVRYDESNKIAPVKIDRARQRLW